MSGVENRKMLIGLVFVLSLCVASWPCWPVAHTSVVVSAQVSTATPVPTCPANTVNGERRCHSVRIQSFATPQVVGITAKLDAQHVPCVVDGFSLAAIWISGDHYGDGLPSGAYPWVEFGSSRQAGDICPTSNPPRYYSFCGYCYTDTWKPPGPSSSNGYVWHGNADESSGDDLFVMYRENTPSVDNPLLVVNRWEWWLNAELIRVAENPLLNYAKRVQGGGETTSWSNDLGRVLFYRLSSFVRRPSGITYKVADEAWRPYNAAPARGVEDGAFAKHRYWTFYWPRGRTLTTVDGEYAGAGLEIVSDNSIPGNSLPGGTSRCDYSDCPRFPPTSTP